MGRIWGYIFIAFGAVWCWDGWRLETTQRADSMFDELGPDRYLVVLGVIMLAVGVALALKPPPSPLKLDIPEGGSKWWPPRPPVTFTLAMIAYTIAIPPLGYAIATFLFFLLIFYLAGKRSLVSNFAYGTASAVIFYFLFDKFADMPLPVGPLGF
ncbi:tripartite tricarboxylate transporter TctB family protein [Aquabacter sp. CN5-332]|uniref:tripartite tricarboxylate transporter TctB family protein n=1 Tax=Aquabacter sp. CN5-332 TaxID=3156608 RepID=UPI0032B526BD